jgi:ribosome-associated protein
VKIPHKPILQDAVAGEKSKSQRKREMTALQDIGEQLVELTRSQLDKLALPEALMEAVQMARSMNQRGARKRQLQYIGKVMRSVDADPIRAALEALGKAHQHAAGQFHAIERWRDRLLTQGDAALEEFFEKYPDADRQHLRQLVRNAMAEKLADKAPRVARVLFHYLREVMQINDAS